LRIIQIFLISVFFFSCREKDLSDIRSNTTLVSGVLIQNMTIDSISVFGLSEEIGGNPIPLLATVSVASGSDPVSVLNNVAPGYFSSDPGQLPIISEHQYAVEIVSDRGTCRANVQVPPAIDLLGINKDSLIFNPNSLGSPAFIISWTGLDLDKYAYVLSLENPEGDLVEIPFLVPSGNFKSQYAGTWVQSGVSLYDTDFKYFGTHKFRVYGIDKQYEEVFYYGPSDLRGLLRAAPDNIEGGKGYITAVSMLELNLTILP
jgi:hypothetical protein